MRWDGDTLTVTPVLRYRIGPAIGGESGDLWPLWSIHRARRQVNLIGWPLDPWYYDGVVGCATTKAAARAEAERLASLIETSSESRICMHMRQPLARKENRPVG